MNLRFRYAYSIRNSLACVDRRGSSCSCRDPNIIGIKDSSGNVQVSRRLLRQHLQNFRCWSALPAAYIVAAIGARGAILALACALPEKCVALFELFQQGHHEKTRELQAILVRASKLIVSSSASPA